MKPLLSILSMSALNLALVTTAWAQMPHSTLVPAKLLLQQTIGSKFSKAGDPLRARLSSSVELQDGTLLHKGTLLTGKILSVGSSHDHSDSRVALQFDQARIRAGKTIPIQVTIVEIAEPYDARYQDDVWLDPHVALPEPPQASLMPATRGAYGIQSQVSSKVSGTVLRHSKDLLLDEGTQFKVGIRLLGAS